MLTENSNLLLSGDTEATPRVRNRHSNSRVIIEIVCPTSEDKAKAKEIVMYHLETLQPQFKETKHELTAVVLPLDTHLFSLQEGLDIIRLTLAQSITFTEFQCSLKTN